MNSADLFLQFDRQRADIVLNRPLSRNALTLEMWAALPTLIAQAEATPSIRALGLRGAGGTFSAGVDIKEFRQAYATASAAETNQKLMQSAMTALEHCPKPTIALIEGACIGGACGLALCCDFRFASNDARFAITPAKLGLVYGLSDTRRLVDAIGLSGAQDLLFTGRTIDAAEALALGLVDRVVKKDQMADAATGFTTSLAATSAFSARATKQIMRRLRAGHTDDDAESRALFASAFEGEDFQEGLRAFDEKRSPRFT